MQRFITDKIWNYKNFSMGTELDIAGEFIYDGIHTLNQLQNIDEPVKVFSFLYHTSVGLERLQKIILVLFEDEITKDIEVFEKSLITHSHIELSKRINDGTDLKMNKRENDFLALIANFYKSARYNRFNITSKGNDEVVLIEDYILKYIPAEKIERHFITNKINITEDIKTLFGRVIGNIANKYYKLVREGCNMNNTFTYELRSDSKAEKIFYAKTKKNSLYDQKLNESIVIKEFLVYIRNTTDNSSFLRFMNAITPLELESAVVNEYIDSLCKGNVSQGLIDEVEHLYEENSYSKDRLNTIELMGNSNILWNYNDTKECFELLDKFIDGRVECKEFADDFPQKLKLVEDFMLVDSLVGLIDLCNEYLDGKKPEAEFKDESLTFYNTFKESFGYLTEE
jgi:hypothetical protein